jgi:mannobiose 2-epimerase
LEHYAADRRNGGYFEWLRRDGSYIPPPPSASRDKRLYTLNTLVGYKSMNTHLHLLEAYTLLYEVWPNKDLRNRLDHLLHIVRDRIAVAPGALNLYFTPDWHAVPAHDSFGHDVEAAFLLTEAVKTLGRAEDAATWNLASQLVDHALVWGWDEKFGGFYDKGEAFFSAHDTRKFGWVQAEGLNALLLMHARFVNENGSYFKAFTKQWHFIRSFQIDHRHGGWHRVLTREGRVTASSREPDETGAIYHFVRAMIKAIRALRNLCKYEDKVDKNSAGSVAHEQISN